MPDKAKKPVALWLEEGLRILEQKGPGALSIDQLARRTGKTKGSFYHHFKNRENYIEALMDYYDQKTTVDILHTVDAETDRLSRLKKLTELVFQLSSRLELAVRAWALVDPVVKACQDRIDQKRLNHLQRIYRPTCPNAAGARSMAFKNYALYIGIQQLRHLHDTKQFKTLLRDIFLS